MNENSLNNKLNRIDETLNIMKTNLHLSENEVIENLAEATNLHTLANIFIQEEEPSIKDGIWIQAKKETHLYDTVKIDKDIIIPEKWRLDNAPILTINNTPRPYDSNSSRFNNYLCVDGRHFMAIEYQLYELNPNTGVLTAIGYLSGRAGFLAASDKYICHYGSNASFSIDCFDLQTGIRRIVKATKNLAAMCYSPYDKHFYTYGDGGLCKFDPDTQVYTATGGKGIDYCSSLIPIGSKILGIGTTDRWGLHNGLFDIDNGYSYTSLNDKLDTLLGGDYKNLPIIIGNSVYLVLYKDPKMEHVYKIDMETFEYEDVVEKFTDSDLIKPLGLSYDDRLNQFYVINYENSRYHCIPMTVNTVQYDKNMIVIMQSPITKSEKQTALWTYPCLEGRMLQSFFDVYYYNKETGFDFALPIYYGDGTKWVKFKN